MTKDDLRIPTVSRVLSDTLIELVYDETARKTGLAVSRFNGLWNIEQEVKIETGELLVPYSATNNLIVNGCVLLPSKPEEYGLKHELIGDIKAFLHRYVDLSPSFEIIAAYYILLSWVHDAFGDLPYLRLLGEYGTGKTRGLLTIGSLCYRPFFASGASTVSPIFHTLDSFGGTLVLDEADLPYSDAKAELVKILNNGTTKGMPVLRTLQNRHKEFNPYAFKVFGPKLIASRESFQDRGLESRFITEETGTRALRSDIPIHMPKAMKAEALVLRNRLLHFRLSEFFQIQVDLSALITSAEARLNQMVLPLLSLVDDPSLRVVMQSYFIDAGAEAIRRKQEAPEARVLVAALATIAANDSQPMSVRDITKHFNETCHDEYGGAASPRWVGEILRSRLHLTTRKSNGLYVIPPSERPKLIVLAQRYGIECAL